MQITAMKMKKKKKTEILKKMMIFQILMKVQGKEILLQVEL